MPSSKTKLPPCSKPPVPVIHPSMVTDCSATIPTLSLFTFFDKTVAFLLNPFTPAIEEFSKGVNPKSLIKPLAFIGLELIDSFMLER